MCSILQVPRRRCLKTIRLHRFFNSKPTDHILIPPPTWSIQDLQLFKSEQDTLISDEEYHRLAYRCLIDVRILSTEDNLKMKQSLTDIMKCVSLVTKFTQEQEITPNSSQDKESASSVRSNDLDSSPRQSHIAFKHAPKKFNSIKATRSTMDEKKAWDSHDGEEAERVMQYIRQGDGQKMMKREEDGQWYFSIRTATDE